MKRIEDVKVSVVTPVYNGEKHLAKCIESVLAQTHTNFEYLIVNNCSTDRTLAIANEYAARDRRIRVHSNPQLLDVVASHNKAFSLAPPENDYVKIIGGDDWLYPECLHEMVKLAEQHPNVGMVTSYVLVGSKIGWDGLPIEKAVLSGREICRLRLLNGILVFGGPSASLLRTSVVKERDPFYTVGYYHGDNDAYLDLLQRHDFGFVHKVLTYNRRGEDSPSTHYLQSFNSNMLAVVEELEKFGDVYLTKEEKAERLKIATDDYYRFLARAKFEFRPKKFWDAHRERLNRLGQPLDRAKLYRYMFARFLDVVLNPKRTVENIFRRLHDRSALQAAKK